MELKNHTIEGWTVPTIELPGAARVFPPMPIFGTIINSIVDGQSGRERQQKWKVQVASEVKSQREEEPWNPKYSFAITLALGFHSANHGNRPLDVENFIKPILDALAGGLFCDPQIAPANVQHGIMMAQI